ncbi:DUF262 domain-containing protein [Corynebacterium coyleae]|uniref:DUF262 domain-containing protein n=1 Tax=Corynebacterium coyleae TaxID=53374 RepID=UPI001CCBB90F|nr:DUF262 domain-containing protein [Corynebacterium coyleae]UBI09846.1 DUF262 domain-containing protein [Corynebacterium coyleae]
MKAEFYTSDLSSVLARIIDDEIDLQPEFQRGLVWPKAKQARLIDTVLRGWAIPPVHLIAHQDDTMSVLDGQQRLTALRDFKYNKFKIGGFPPDDEKMKELKGLTFSELNADTQRRFLKYRIPCYEIYDYEPSEPYELFFRLNQPTGLTSAEKRNALFGEARHQVSQLVKAKEWDPKVLGFSNNRMSYDDVAARACVLVEKGRLDTSLRSQAIDEFYRSKNGFNNQSLETVEIAMKQVRKAVEEANYAPKFNKATLLSWIMFFARAELLGIQVNGGKALMFVNQGTEFFNKLSSNQSDLTKSLQAVYRDRSSLRVTDVLSVLARDFCIWQLALIANAVDFSADQPFLVRATESIRQIQHREPDEDYEIEIISHIESSQTWGLLR